MWGARQISHDDFIVQPYLCDYMSHCKLSELVSGTRYALAHRPLGSFVDSEESAYPRCAALTDIINILERAGSKVCLLSCFCKILSTSVNKY